MSPNGALLAEIVEQHHMIVANGTKNSTGTITRRRITKNNIEESAIDIVAFSHELKDHFVSFNVDEARKLKKDLRKRKVTRTFCKQNSSVK